MKHSLKALLAASTILVASCANLPPSEPGSLNLSDLPDTYDYQDVVKDTAMGDEPWWSRFEDDTLDQLVEAALAENQDIETGLASVAAARASVKVAGSSLLPSASGSASAGSSSSSGLEDISTSGRLNASYEVDVFGANRANVEAARYSLYAQLFQQRAVELSVQADVASFWFTLLSAREQLAVARKNLDIAERIFGLTEIRYDAGVVPADDVERQRASLANTRSRIPQLEQQIENSETALAILLGRPPQGFDAPEGDVLALSPPEVSAGTPSQLLTRRPDLLAAEAGLRVQDANIAIARAAFLPSFDLGAALSSTLFEGLDPLTSLSAGLNLPIFTGGRLEGQLEGQQARQAAQLSQYRQAVLNALGDVDLALLGQRTAKTREAQLVIARDASAKALDAAELRYRVGSDDLTALLNAQTSFFSASNDVVIARLNQLQASVSLFAALGGGWGGDVYVAPEGF